MATGLGYGAEPSPGLQRDQELGHLRPGGHLVLMENTTSAGKMQGILKKASKIFQQTRALLWKNILLVWRMKIQSFQEWLTSAVFLFMLRETADMIWEYPRAEFPYKVLGQLDDPAFNATGLTLMYTPVTNTTRRIMGRVASDSVLRGIIIEEMENEEKMETKGTFEDEVIGVVFKDDFSYSLRLQISKTVFPNDVFDHIESCGDYSESYCKVPLYWYGGFLSVQSSIDAAVIEMKTNHSVWKEMKSIAGVRLKSPLIKPVFRLDYVLFIFCAILCYSPFMYFLSVKVLREKKKLKVLMGAMGLQDVAFWLSWSLLYTVYISISASLLALITLTDALNHQSFLELYLFYFFYGMASIHFTFMISSLLKQPNIVSFVGFLLHILFGSVGFLTLFDLMPPSAGWILNLFSPFAFTSGLATMVKLEKHGPASNPKMYPLYNFYLALSLDSVLYFLLAIYFDKVLPGKYGVPHPPAFFLRPSYWFKPSSGSVGVTVGSESTHDPVLSGDAEPMPPGFDGKEAIRASAVTLFPFTIILCRAQLDSMILVGPFQLSTFCDSVIFKHKVGGVWLNNIKKTYKKKGKSTEALKGLSLNIYEGQITALLGHSGCGKTALLNVLSGFSKPSAGSAMIYNYSVSEIPDREGIQAMVGVCPQLNLHFEALTMKENLRTFAHIKGIERKEVEQEVQKVLVMLDLTDLQNICADALSRGEKRKLSLGIAILGNPQVLLLDEPTAGLDPCSRHHVWSLLKERRAGHVTLFSTQSMEEADVHADRKAFLSNGRLQSVGSSLYLKRKWGIGYHLRMHTNDLCDPELISSLVRQYIPDAVLKGKKRDELCYMLPLENTDSFPDLFSHLESSLLQGVVNYEVTRTTLEDVFLKLEGEEAVDGEGDRDLEERDQILPGFPRQGILAGSGMRLWRQQVCAVMRVRLLKLRHDGKLLRAVLLLFGTFMLPLMMILTLIQLWHSSSSWEITASPYFLPTREKIQNKSSNLLILNDTGSEMEDFIAALKTQSITPEITLEKNITSLPHHSGAIKVSLEGKSYQFTVMCGAEPINCYPLLVNIISNTFLRLFNSTARIRLWSELLSRTESSDLKNYTFFNCLSYLLILAAGLPPLLAVSSMEDYKLQARSQLRLSGLFPSAYWCGQALVDVPFFWTLMCLMFGLLVAFSHTCPLQASTTLLLIICIVGYGVSLVLLIYLIAFKVGSGRSNRHVRSLVFILVNYALYIISNQDEPVYYTCCLIPVFPPLGWMMFSAPHFTILDNDELLQTWNHIYMAVFAPYLHCVIFAFLLRHLEMRYGGVTRFDPVFRIQQKRVVAQQNRDHPGEEPPEVQAERERVRSAMVSLQQDEESVVIVNSLRKEYEVKKANSIFKKQKKLAVKNVSFSVKKGEVLGLLGPNGAGKSTTINMISGEVTVTAGEVLLRDHDAATLSPGCLGCCPQQDPLWPDLTVLQHLEVFAAVRGMRKEDAALTISCIAKALDLLKHFKTPARRLSAGEARKLCFALSILGDPTVMLWDEPSVGMDPKGQRRMWKVIQSSMKSKERAAILSTQSPEAAAMCDRVAILVSGRLRYIGSPEDLKSKFGTSYHLEIKMSDPEKSDALHADILNLFPGAARQGRTSSLLIYKIPMADALPLSRSFSKLEAAKQNFRLEEYSLSLNTLQQVFVDITRDAEEHDLDATSNGAVEQRPLQP